MTRLFACFLLLAGCTSIVTTSLPPQDVDSSFRHTRFNWSSGNKVAFAYRIFESAGKVAICGVYAESPGGDADIAPFNDRLIQTASLDVSGDTLVNDISFFAVGQYDGKGRAAGKANCVQTEDPWSEKVASAKSDLEFAKTHFTVYD